MPTTVPALKTAAADQPFERGTIERRDPKPHDVVIDIKYAGICHSDIHTARSEWPGTVFPLVPGHEIAGVVTAVGDEVTKHAVGDHVGIGCFVDSCRECENCRAGDEQFCSRGPVMTYSSQDYDGEQTYGGYSTQIVADENYVLRIPEGLGLDVAAPLLCAGITLYNPLKRWGAGPGKRVAIVGLGGLGHVGVKLAHAMGAEVTVLSQSLKKEEDGKRLGADAYYATSDESTFEDLAGHFDLIVNTVSAKLDLEAYVGLLRTGGSLVNVGVPPESASVTPGVLMQRKSVAASMIGGIADTQEMLDFCAEHGVGAEIETIGADQVNEAYDRVVASDVRYRFVIDVATLAG